MKSSVSQVNRFLLPIGFVVLLAAGTAAGGGQKGKPAAAPIDLVWPLPPDVPWIRFLAMYTNNFDIEPRKKLSWVDRLIGKPDPNVTVYFQRPAGITTDTRGRILVASMQLATVFVLNPENHQVLQLRGDRGIVFKNPLGLAVDSHDNLYVSDPVLRMVLKFDPQYHLVATFGEAEAMKNPTFLALDEPRRRLFVVDSHLHQVLVYKLDTLELIARVGKRGTKDGEFNYPVGIGVNRQGYFAVTDTSSCSVQIFSPDLKFVRRFGTQGIQPGQFVRPKGVAFDSQGDLYVADAAFNNFQIFNPKGQVLMYVGSFGSQPGAFNLPLGIYIDAKDRVYVSDQLNARVQVFQFLGGN
jgi:sugar lactone lactonase YvrE